MCPAKVSMIPKYIFPTEVVVLLLKKRGKYIWGSWISLSHAHIPKRKHNAQKTFCKIIHWRIAVLGKLSLFIFIFSTCPNISLLLPFTVSCVRPCVR